MKVQNRHAFNVVDIGHCGAYTRPPVIVVGDGCWAYPSLGFIPPGLDYVVLRASPAGAMTTAHDWTHDWT